MYVDKSNEEFSIHQLDELDIELIYEAVIVYFNQMPFPSRIEDRPVKKKIVAIKKQIENELYTKQRGSTDN